MADHNDVDDLETTDSREGDGPKHATTGGAAAAGAVSGGIAGAIGAGPIGAAAGAVSGAIMGAVGERIMHADDDREGKQLGLDNDRDKNVLSEDRRKEGVDADRGFGPRSDGGAQTVQLREEELSARKESREAGQVSLDKDVVTEHRSIDVPVKREEVYVERHPVDRRPSNEPIGAGERDITVTAHEEQVDVQKRPVVYEEVEVGKRTAQDTQRVEGEVRREEVRIDRDGDVNIADNASDRRP